MKNLKIPSVKIIIVSLIVLVLVGVASFFGWQWYRLKNQLVLGTAMTEEAVKQETARLVKEVSALIDLPSDEEPTIATVSDLSKLESQPFFEKAKNGDKVLFYTEAKKAYLYRPSEKRLIEVAPLLVGDQASPTPTAVASGSAVLASPAPLRVALYNGSKTTGLTNAKAQVLLKEFPTATIVGRETAKKTDYAGTIVVNVNNAPKETVDKIASLFSGTVDVLPTGESKPDADILIILTP